MAVGTNIPVKQENHQPTTLHHPPCFQNRRWFISRWQTSWLSWVRNRGHTVVVGSHSWGPEPPGHTLTLFVLTCALYTPLAPTHTLVTGSFLKHVFRATFIL